MRYSQSKEQSAEILRLTLPLMAKQDAAYHPLSYALWYEHVAGLNPRLTDVLEQRLAAGAPLTDADVWRLHTEYITARDLEAFERVQQRLHSLLEDTARIATHAGAEAWQFGDALQGHHAQLEQSINVDIARRVIGELLMDTERMRNVTVELSRQLDARAREVHTLTERLHEAQIEALLDALTGLTNRRGFERRVQELRDSRGGLAGASLLLADIDHFKAINDMYGHVVGDKVIRSVAEILNASIKGRDIAARLGGEEFAVLLPETPLAGAATLAEQIRTVVARGRIRYQSGEEEVGRVTLSIGIAAAKADDTIERLLERADAAMYAAKRAGRNCVRY